MKSPGEVVQYCLAQGKRIEDLTLAELKEFSNKIDKNVYDYLSADAVVDRRRALGGTARAQRGAPLERIEGLDEAIMLVAVIVLSVLALRVRQEGRPARAGAGGAENDYESGGAAWAEQRYSYVEPSDRVCRRQGIERLGELRDLS